MTLNPLRAPALAALLLAAAMAPTANAATANMSFSQGERNGVCMVGFKGPNAPGTESQMTLQFTYRVKDGNVGATILVNGWERAQEADPEKNIPMTLVFDTGKSAPARSGGYDSGFNDSAWAGWGAGEASYKLYALMDGASTVRVLFDGMDLGPFDLQFKGIAHSVLKTCADRVRAAAN
ncbi:MAG: hypothetical protein GC145_18475 [Caulobacter sp.]|nr:hypothetical protein [Caulobacter sp.]